jgi:nitronate monooxygenase
MSITTPLTEMLRIEHPILLAPMDLVAGGQLAAAVTHAGGFGMIGGGYGDETWLRREMDAAGTARVGVGFITWSMARQPRLLDLVLERRPPAVMLSFGDIQPHADRIKKSGALVIAQIQTVEQAKEVIRKGVDILVAQGAEAGGHGISRGTFALVPAAVDVSNGLPVVAAGGVGDGRGLAAALMLGAQGVLIGTRFYATQEAAGRDEAKKRIVAATGDRTIRGILFDIARRNVWPAPYCGRVLRNDFSERWQGREAELLQRQDEAARYAVARDGGDFDVAAVIAGEVVDLIHDIPAAGDVVRRIADEAEEQLARTRSTYRLSTS